MFGRMSQLADERFCSARARSSRHSHRQHMAWRIAATRAVILSRPSFCRMSQLRTKQKQQPPTCGMDKTTMVWSGDDNGCVSNLVE
jgi:hypothetical protein